MSDGIRDDPPSVGHGIISVVAGAGHSDGSLESPPSFIFRYCRCFGSSQSQRSCKGSVTALESCCMMFFFESCRYASASAISSLLPKMQGVVNTANVGSGDRDSESASCYARPVPDVELESVRISIQRASRIDRNEQGRSEFVLLGLEVDG